MRRKRGIWTTKLVSWTVPRKMVETSEDLGDQGWYSHSERMGENRAEVAEVLKQQILYNSLMAGSL